MTPCPCGCAGVVAPGRKFAARACWHRLVTPAMRSAFSKGHGRPPLTRVRKPCARDGCLRDFAVRGGVRAKQRYCSGRCATLARTGPAWVAWHQRRAEKAAAARRVQQRAASRKRVALLTPMLAYEQGYRVGYMRAYRWWAHQYRLLQRQIAKAS